MIPQAQEKSYKEYCLIGLNKFNYEIGLVLVAEGHKVTVLDSDPKVINEFGPEFSYAIVCDCRNIKELEDVGVQFFDYVILGITNMETSVIAAANLKKLKVNNILCKAKSETHRRILNMLGISIAFIPEEEIALKIAYKAMYDLNVELFTFDKEIRDTLLIRVPVLNRTLWNRKVAEIAFLRTISATLISIKKKDGHVIVPVSGEHMIDVGDIVCLICKKDNIKKVKEFFRSQD